MVRTCAHGQSIDVEWTLPLNRKVMIYDAEVTQLHGRYRLQLGETTKEVVIPDDSTKTFTSMKEICAGIGGISMAAEFLGIQVQAMMDTNQKMVTALQMNGGDQALCGDITNAQDRYRLHVHPAPTRGILACGFPCQPLSQQGDRLGQLDQRSLPFFAATRTMWEQQMTCLLLECVPAALKASYVQNELQKLSAAMGCHIYQRILNLSNCWPCNRTRWWCLLVPIWLALSQGPKVQGLDGWVG